MSLDDDHLGASARRVGITLPHASRYAWSCRIFELDNLPAGTGFNEIEIHAFDISNMRSHGVQPTLRVMAPPQ